MEREAFSLTNGESFSAWELRFTGLERHREISRCIFREP